MPWDGTWDGRHLTVMILGRSRDDECAVKM
jgi:hypothetical protein